MQTILLNRARAAIIEAAKATGISHSRLYGTCRTPRVVQTRWACFLVLRRLGLSFAEIGAEFGKDHGTVMHGVFKGTALLKSEPWFFILVAHLETHLA